jgi:hypothetical protein
MICAIVWYITFLAFLAHAFFFVASYSGASLQTRDHINALVGACYGMGNVALVDLYVVKDNGCIYSLALLTQN